MKQAQSDRILCHLSTGRPITPLQALHKFGTLRLAARIADLREDGHKITSELVARDGKRFSEYRLAGRT